MLNENNDGNIFDVFQAGSSPVSSISGFSVGSGRVDEAVDDFKVSEPSYQIAPHARSG